MTGTVEDIGSGLVDWDRPAPGVGVGLLAGMDLQGFVAVCVGVGHICGFTGYEWAENKKPAKAWCFRGFSTGIG